MKRAVRDAGELYRRLQLDPNAPALSEYLELSQQGEKEFPVFVPLEFLDRMKAGDPRDPLLLQVLPRKEESIIDPSFVRDPVGDSNVEEAPGLLHKYHGRVLLILSGACAIHCRYCFRRHYPYATAPKNLDHWRAALEYIRGDTTIQEVILSGGDPLMVADEQLSRLIDQLETIPHLTRLRIHSRLPVVIPQRINSDLCDWLSRTRFSTWMVLHINHSQELDVPLMEAIGMLQRTGTMVLNQAVLLRDVNDNVAELKRLCERLVNCGVIPYYLHQLDRVTGATHFEVEKARGIELMKELATQLPGYAVPRYVSEIAGEPNKTIL